MFDCKPTSDLGTRSLGIMQSTFRSSFYLEKKLNFLKSQMQRRNGNACSLAALAVVAALSQGQNSYAQEQSENKGGVPPNGRDISPASHVHTNDELVIMQQYLTERIDRSAIRKSLVTAVGRKVDCVDIEAQPALKNAALRGHKLQAPPEYVPEPIAAASAADILQRALFENTASIGNAASAMTCPNGTVPILDVTMDDLRRFDSLEDFFSRGRSRDKGHSMPHSKPLQVEPPYHVGVADEHQYAIGYRWDPVVYGARMTMNVWNSSTARDDEFSLGQLWVSRGSDAQTQTLEAGAQKYPLLYKDNNAHLFIYSTRMNYATGSGCYNNSCADFVQVSSGSFPGMVLASSTMGGTQAEIDLSWIKFSSEGDWWLSGPGGWIGYYPAALFSDTGLKINGGLVEFGGEVINHQSSGLHTATDMGSGAFPSAGYQQAAYMRKISYANSIFSGMGPPYPIFMDAGLLGLVSDPLCYNINIAISSDWNWKSHFYYGGPGYDSENCR